MTNLGTPATERHGDPDPDATRLAASLAATYVTGVDPHAIVNSNTWQSSAAEYAALRTRLTHAGQGDEAVSAPLRRLADEPADGEAHRDLIAGLAARLRADPGVRRSLEAALDAVSTASYVSYHLGDAYVRDARADSLADPGDVLRLCPERTPGGQNPAPDIAVIIPLRALPGDESRLRNAVAAVAAAGTQTLPRERFTVVVVEQDDEPRCEKYLAGLTDTYVFARNAGDFNKSWAFNMGVNAAPGARQLCFLDADILLAEDALESVVRELDSGTECLLPYREVVYLDQGTSALAISERLGPVRALPFDRLRGYGLKDTWGGCICLTRRLYDSVGGYDERFRGWGDEDNEFYRQIIQRTPVPRWEMPMAHLWHARPVMADAEGVRPNQHIAGTARPTVTGPLGNPHKYAHEVLISEGEAQL
ncbi:glycosyltransferase [Streptomyces sp. NPDC001985]|uniref:glycosyltransferase n=1 Tax=Streptomyces sp. NPDC001985 TaxID=3154406 RepID=UPI003325072B